MNKIAPLIVLFISAMLIGNPVLAKGKEQAKGKQHAQVRHEKGKGQYKAKRQTESRWENTNKQALESSERGRERSEERHDMHEPQGYGDPRYGDPRYSDPRYGDPRYGSPQNSVDAIIDQGADSLKSGARNLLPPPR